MDNSPIEQKPNKETIEENKTVQENVVDNNDKVMFALSYATFGIVAIILLLTKKGDKEARYHSLNSLFLWVGLFIVNCALGILTFIPFIGLLIAFIVPILSFAVWIYSIILAIDAYNGKKPVIPTITDFMEKTTSSWNI